MPWNWQSLWLSSMQSVIHKNINNLSSLFRCKGTGFIPATYRPCPRCGGEGKGVLRDCRLCDDLCYVTEPWVQCQVCFGRGRQGHTELSPDCYACRGVGFVKPGFGVGGPAYGTYGASAAPGMVPPMYPPPVQPGFGAAPYGAGFPPAYY